jgi:hypothetical protein
MGDDCYFYRARDVPWISLRPLHERMVSPVGLACRTRPPRRLGGNWGVVPATPGHY